MCKTPYSVAREPCLGRSDMHPDTTISPERAAAFWNRVDKTGDCWLWTGGLSTRGYGRTTLRDRSLDTHRFAWMVSYGPIPDGLCVCHHCDNPPCCRPEHLFLGTHADNNADREAKGRTARGERSGHYTHPERTARGERAGLRLHPERAPRGERNGRALLTEQDVRTIRTLAALGTKAPTIARQFRVAPATVYHILWGMIWKHVK